MHPASVSKTRRIVLALGALAVSAGLTGCYVVPVNPQTGQPVGLPPVAAAPAPIPAPVQPVTFSARLYPANDLASVFGMVNAVVTNDLNGRGTFSTTINGESFTGEATRRAGSPRDGIASGSGNRGSFLSCTYTMNSTVLGSGQCRHSGGALFTMHVGQ
jgi:hypothetical protein